MLHELLVFLFLNFFAWDGTSLFDKFSGAFCFFLCCLEGADFALSTLPLEAASLAEDFVFGSFGWDFCFGEFVEEGFFLLLWFTRHWFWTLVFIGRRVIHWSIFVRTEYQVLHDIFIQSYLFLVLCFSLLLFLLLLGRFSPVNQGRVVQINNLPWQGSN